MLKQSKIAIEDFSVHYHSDEALRKINLQIQPNEIFTIFGPARGGKTPLLKSLNRLRDLIPGTRHTGTILIDGTDIYDPKVDLYQLRRRIGMVFDLPTPLPLSIFDNISYGPRLRGINEKQRLKDIVETS